MSRLVRLTLSCVIVGGLSSFCRSSDGAEGLGYCYYHLGLLAREMGARQIEKEKLQAALAIFTELKMPRERDAVQADLDRAREGSPG